MRNHLFEQTRLIDRFLPMNVFEITTNHPTVIEPHWHEHFELIYLEQGKVTFHIGGSSYQAVPGDLMFVNSSELHAGYTDSTEVTSIVHAIVFHPSIISSASSEADYTAPYISGKSIVATIISKQNSHYDKLIEIVMTLIKEFRQKENGHKIAMKAYCQILFISLARGYTVKRENNLKFQLKVDRFKDLLNQIDQSFSDRLSLDEAAAMVHMSPYHFCKTFKQFTGSTYVQYVNHRRIAEAENLLLNTTLSITEISERVGSANVNSFSKLYKQFNGFPPTKARKK